RPLLVERRLPWLPEEIAALTLATIRSLLRAPELKMAFVMPLVFGLIFVLLPMSSQLHAAGAAVWSGFIVTGVGMVASFSIAPTMANVFGLDRNGFRALVLLPTRRDYILVAKNLAFFPFVLLVSLILLVLLKYAMHCSWSVLLPAV